MEGRDGENAREVGAEVEDELWRVGEGGRGRWSERQRPLRRETYRGSNERKAQSGWQRNGYG